jgi:two-component system chemotaxis sensor kinase CheA
MIRNAVDHGSKCRKSDLRPARTGRRHGRLTAKHRSGRIVIELSDDGAGINREKGRRRQSPTT